MSCLVYNHNIVMVRPVGQSVLGAQLSSARLKQYTVTTVTYTTVDHGHEERDAVISMRHTPSV